jgi:LytR cell envelope-related transcriptional attenuator
VNLSTGRVLVIVALVVVGLAVLANGFSDSGTSAATLTPTPSPAGGGHTSSSTSTPPPTSSAPTPTPAPETKGVLFMAMNGTDVPGAGAAAQQKLTDAGYTSATDAIDAPTSGIKKTIVYYRDDDNAPQNQSNATYVADKFFKKAIVKPLDPSLQGVPKSATIVVVVGEDYAQQLVGG